MNTVFADTSLFVAFVSERDEFHEAAVEVIRTTEDRILTTEWVLMELGNYLAKFDTRTVFLPLLKLLQVDKRFEIVAATHDQFLEGAILYDQRPDQQWSLADCISFNVMRSHNLSTAITADHHFEQAGFTCSLSTH